MIKHIIIEYSWRSPLDRERNMDMMKTESNWASAVIIIEKMDPPKPAAGIRKRSRRGALEIIVPANRAASPPSLRVIANEANSNTMNATTRLAA